MQSANLNAQSVRSEHDSLGLIDVPNGRLYGAQTARAIANFPVSGRTLTTLPDLIRALAMVKIAGARANAAVGDLSFTKADAIIKAAEEILAGEHHDEFAVDVFQGGAGTSTNMNMNEVLANRAEEILGGERGQYRLIHPNDHVNKSQSTNDAYATAARLAVYLAGQKLKQSLVALGDAFQRKAEAFATIRKLGRTQMQDAVPMTLGQEFGAFATTIREDVQRLSEIESYLLEVNLGGTAIGTGVAASDGYRQRVVNELKLVTGLAIVPAENLIEATWDMGAFVLYASMLKRIASKLSKIGNDLRLLSSGPRSGIGEIRLPPLQPGSSIMPGKVNPVAPELISQVAFYVYGVDTMVGMAAESGQLQLNFAEPLIVHSLTNAVTYMSNAINAFIRTCVDGIEADEARCAENLARSTALATALVPVIGYEAAAKLANRALAEGKTIAELVAELTEDTRIKSEDAMRLA
jgi:aspartate ammonia-lyase